MGNYFSTSFNMSEIDSDPEDVPNESESEDEKNPLYQDIKNASGFGEKVDENEPDNKWSLLKMVNDRQSGVGQKKGAFTQNDKCKINNLYIPNHAEKSLIKLETKIFCGNFTKDGDRFLTGSQDQKIRIFDSTTTKYNLLAMINCKHVSWCILDIDFSHDGQYFAYSSWAECLHICPINGTDDDIHCLNLNTNASRFGAFSLAFSNSGKEIISGGSDACVYVYDRDINERVLKIPVRNVSTDVNTVGFVDESSNLFYSGADDACIKIWDRRCLNESRPEPVGMLLGHLDGITYIDSRNDGRYLLSNSKDQSIKLWDMRKFSPRETEDKVNTILQSRNWDYRWDKVPRKYYSNSKPIDGDTSIITYKGHRIQKSLIRAKFSPAATTGQRYIYTVYDVLTGKMVNGGITGHNDIVRDVAWHPKRSNEILTSSWDYSVNLNTFQDKLTEKKRPRSSNPTLADPRNDSDDDLMDVAPPLRRSSRIAQRSGALGLSRRFNNRN
ncbi:unnamed protein product [Diamesa serratosioi]